MRRRNLLLVAAIAIVSSCVLCGTATYVAWHAITGSSSDGSCVLAAMPATQRLIEVQPHTALYRPASLQTDSGENILMVAMPIGCNVSGKVPVTDYVWQPNGRWYYTVLLATDETVLLPATREKGWDELGG